MVSLLYAVVCGVVSDHDHWTRQTLGGRDAQGDALVSNTFLADDRIYACSRHMLTDGDAGILPRDGRNISFKDLNNRCRETFNFSPTFSFYVPHYAATMLERNYWTDTFDLADISAHNCIEHDASLCRACPASVLRSCV